jgi:hypothetical protein
MSIRFVSIVLALALGVGAAPKPKFTATWKSPDAKPGAYAGKKVVGLVMSDDFNLRMSTEEAIARAVTARGVDGVAAYRLIPKEEIRNPESVKAWFQRAGASALLVMRLVDLRSKEIPSAVVWSSGAQYTSWGSYYPYAWGQATVLSTRTDTTFEVETLLFDVASGHLQWAGTSESANPKDAQALVAAIVDVAADEIKKDGLIKGK